MLKENKGSGKNEHGRSDRREFQKADMYLQTLVNIYIRFKNAHIKEEQGYIYLEPDVMIKFDELNQKWKDFCFAFKTNTARRWRFDIAKFKNAIDMHLERHRMLCWVNYVLKICREKHRLFPTVKMVQDLYPGTDAELLPIEAVVTIKSKIRSLIMHTLEIPDINYAESFPSEISELSADQFLHFINLFLQWKTKNISIDDFKTLLLLKLLDVKYTAKYEHLKRLYDKSPAIREVKDLIDSNIHLLSEQIDSFFIERNTENGQVEKEINLNFIRNLLPFIRVPFLGIFHRKYFGPADALTNSSFFEYRKAHDLFIKYSEEKDDMDLCRLAAILYRPRKSFLFIRKKLPRYSGDPRREMSNQTNESYIEKRAKRIMKAGISNRYGILLFFKNCEEFLRYGTPKINGNEIDLSIIYENHPDHVSTGPDIGLTGILYTLSESNVFGDIQHVDSQNLYDVMSRLYQVVKQQNDLRESTKSSKP